MTTANSDGRMTAARREYRFMLDEQTAKQAAETIRWHCRLSDSDYFTPWRMTMYWDTPDLSIYRLAESGTSLCLRIREYHAECPTKLLSSTTVWVELKESAAKGRKQRVCLDAQDVAAFFAGEASPELLRKLPARAVKWITAGARPMMVTRCRRLAYEGINDTVRVTIDNDLSYLSADWSNDGRGTHLELGPVVAAERGALIEIKSSDPFPAWANELVASLERHTDDRPSKFVVGMRHVLANSKAIDLTERIAS
jgi:hypothetical protein